MITWTRPLDTSPDPRDPEDLQLSPALSDLPNWDQPRQHLRHLKTLEPDRRPRGQIPGDGDAYSSTKFHISNQTLS